MVQQRYYFSFHERIIIQSYFSERTQIYNIQHDIFFLESRSVICTGPVLLCCQEREARSLNEARNSFLARVPNGEESIVGSGIQICACLIRIKWERFVYAMHFYIWLTPSHKYLTMFPLVLYSLHSTVQCARTSRNLNLTINLTMRPTATDSVV